MAITWAHGGKHCRELRDFQEEQDQLGALSHQRARKAITDGICKQEIAPVVIPQRKGDPLVFDTDERPMDTSAEKMAKLPTAFKKNGTVTAGNASGINDAAAALLVHVREQGQRARLKPWSKSGPMPRAAWIRHIWG